MAMRFLRDIPIKRKLTIITMLTSFVALLLACVAFVAYEQVTFHHTLARDFSILADMFQDNVAPGLAFNDVPAMEKTMQSMIAHPHILAGAVYDKKGTIVAKYQRNELGGAYLWPSVKEAGSNFQPDRLDTFQRITLAGEVIGTVYIGSDLNELNERFLRYALIVSLVLLLSCLAAYLLSTRLQSVISKPIFHLAQTASQVATEKNYSIRAVKHGQDELGSLIDRFNEMLEQIQKQDLALQEANDRLEYRVEERTRELQQEIAERRRTEEERDRFFTVSLDMLCIAGLDGYFRRVNPAFETILGFSPQELMFRPFVEIVHPEDRDRTIAEVQKLAQGKLTLDFENRCLCKDGSYRWIVWTAVPVVETGLIYACGRDITERKQAEAKLEEAHKQLLKTSRQAGMAEVATSVLHNVGNVLNSVSVSAEVVAGKVRQFRGGSLKSVAALLREHAPNLPEFLSRDPRGKELPDYLLKLVEHLAEPQQGILQELDSLRKNIEHIKEIVAMQQSYARGSGVLEPLSVVELVEDAIGINSAGLIRHAVRLVREFAEVPPVVTDRHKVLQILVNVLGNAKYALEQAGADKRLIVRMASDGADVVKIAVIDNGVGIAPENLTRIFQHGFTTKKDGHGFGLHSGALAAQELGGKLTAHSDGLGQGAVFTLELPLQKNLTRG